jgi:hypothetical protein
VTFRFSFAGKTPAAEPFVCFEFFWDQESAGEIVSLAYLHVISFLLVPSEDPGHFMICRINARRLFLMRHATVHSNLSVEFNGEEWASPKLNLFRGRNVEIRKLLTFYGGAKRGNNDKNSEARCLRDSSSTSVKVGVSSLVCSLGSKNKIVTLTILKNCIIPGVPSLVSRRKMTLKLNYIYMKVL